MFTSGSRCHFQFVYCYTIRGFNIEISDHAANDPKLSLLNYLQN